MTKLCERLKTKQVADLVFWIAFILLLAIHCIENTSLTYSKPDWLKLMYLFRNLLYLVLLAKAFFLSTYRVGELWAILGILLTAGLCFLCSDDFSLLEFAIIAIAAKDVPKRQLLWVFVMVKSLSIALTLLASDLDLLPRLWYVQNDTPLDTLGFCHRNVLGSNMAVLCLCWLYLRFRRLHWGDLVACLVLTFVTYFLAISRSSLVIMLASIILVLLMKLFETKLKAFPHTGKLLAAAFVSMFLVSLIGALFYKEGVPFWDAMDKILTKRLSFAHECYIQHGFTLFGQQIPFMSTMESVLTGGYRLILDNSFMRALIYDGLLPGGLFLTLYLVCLLRAWRKGDTGLVACFLVIAVYGVSESFMLDVFYCFPLLLGCMDLFRRRPEGETWEPLPYAKKLLMPLWHWIRRRVEAKR